MTPVPTVSLVVTKAVSSTSNTSIWAVPSMNRSCHSLVEDPKSNESSSSGTIFESTSALNTTLSVSASPSVTVPPLSVVVPVTVKFPPMLTFLAIPTPPLMITAPVVAEVDCVVS